MCNIGPAEIRRRRQAGWFGAIFAAALLATLVALSAPAAWLWLLVLPVAAAAVGFLQAALHFCANFGLRGVYNFGPNVGKTDTVIQAKFRAADRRKANKIILASLVIGVVVAGLAVLADAMVPTAIFGLTKTHITQDRANQVANNPNVTVLAKNLNVPWEVAFLPNGDFLVTERPGTLREVGKHERTITVNGVKANGEGGLLGLALDPDFAANNRLYLYETTDTGGKLSNRVARYQLNDSGLTDEQVILAGIPAGSEHDGGRLKFGPDGDLYISTGETGNTDLAQDKNSLGGKILRIHADGSVPADNPLGNAVYSLGHRNVEGLAWDNLNRLWATEHGRSGLQSGLDEINLITKGANYGWPTIEGDQTAAGLVAPVVNSGPDETWAPAGMAYWDHSLWFGGLRGETLYEAKIDPNGRLSLVGHFRAQLGRIRAVDLGPDGDLYVTTSNTDGRGAPLPGDDKLIKINPAIFR